MQAEMNSSTTGKVAIEGNTLLEQNPSYQDKMDMIKFEHVKLEPYYPEPSSPPLEPDIKEEAEVPKKNNDEPITLLSASGEQRTSIKLETKTEFDDFGIWEKEPIHFNGERTGSAVPSKTVNQHKMQNGMVKICKTRADLPDHLKFLYKCNVCSTAFATQSEMRKHKVIHAVEQPNECKICGKETLKNNMKRHMMIHTGERPYECGVCRKAFSLKSEVRRHEMTHTGEKPYNCDICGKSFTQKSYMNRHMLIHTGEKPHECNVCGKTFTLKNNMKNHMMIHTGERPHECNVCGKAFIRRNDMNNHKTLHTGGRPH